MKDLIGKILRDTYIWTKDNYAEFTRKLSKLEIKRNIFLKLVNTEKDEEEEDFWAKRLSSNFKVFLSFIFSFFYNTLWVYIKYLGKLDNWMRYNNDKMIE